MPLSPLSAIGLLACGDGLVDGDYKVEPLVEFSGTVLVDGSPAALSGRDADLRVALVWARPGGETPEVAVETELQFPAEYTMRLYRPPDEALMIETGTGLGRMAVALPVLFRDADGDGRMGRDEELAGSSSDVLVVWLPEGMKEVFLWDTGPIQLGTPTRDLEAGYHLLLGAECGPGSAQDLPVLPLTVERVPLYVGSDWAALTDLDCDGELTEWDSTCPWENGVTVETWCEQVEELLASDPELAENDPWFATCTEVCE